MLVEAFTWLTTPAPEWARKTGYLKELIAIRARYRRCRDDWAPHLDNTREAIQSAIAICAQRRQAVIYGSGLLLDIPLETLARAFDTVTLVDAAHLRATRRAARHLDNINFVEADIGGVANGLLLGMAKGADSLPRPVPPAIDDDPRIDLVVSANLLTQLPVLPIHFLNQNLNVAKTELDDYARIVMQAHLDHLEGFNAVRCLISETTTRHLDDKGKVMKSYDTLQGLAVPPPDRTWHWNIAPLGEVSRYHAISNIVSASTTAPHSGV
jgi:hypothetical protein